MNLRAFAGSAVIRSSSHDLLTRDLHATSTFNKVVAPPAVGRSWLMYVPDARQRFGRRSLGQNCLRFVPLACAWRRRPIWDFANRALAGHKGRLLRISIVRLDGGGRLGRSCRRHAAPCGRKPEIETVQNQPAPELGKQPKPISAEFPMLSCPISSQEEGKHFPSQI